MWRKGGVTGKGGGVDQGAGIGRGMIDGRRGDILEMIEDLQEEMIILDMRNHEADRIQDIIKNHTLPVDITTDLGRHSAVADVE